MSEHHIYALLRHDSSAEVQSERASILTNVSTTRESKTYCTLFFRGKCVQQPCNLGHHVPEELRPVCYEWLNKGACRFGFGCWWKHSGIEKIQNQREADLILQCRASHEIRCIDFLKEWGGDNVVAVHAFRAFGSSRTQDRVLLVHLRQSCQRGPFVKEFLEACHRTRARDVFARSYSVDGCCASVEDASLAISRSLERFADTLSTAATGQHQQELLVRTQCYPNGLELPLLDSLIQRGLPVPGITVNGGKRVFHVRVCMVEVGGFVYWGVEEEGTPSVAAAAAALTAADLDGVLPNAPTAICRAQHKLLEVLERVPIIAATLCGADDTAVQRVALDVGAAPGGWSWALATACRFHTVYAVDPADLSPMPPNVHHLRMKGHDAVTALLAERGRRCLHALTCDMNTPTDMTMRIFEEAGPVLLPGAAVVLTLKNFNGLRHLWLAELRKAMSRVQEMCTHVQVLHLMSNGSAEVTLCGLWKGEGPVP